MAGSRQQAAGRSSQRIVLPTAHRRLPTSGFTLLEIIVVVGIIAVLAAAVTPALVQQILDRRVQATRDEARLLHEAIVGNPAAMQFGFMGDIGRTPATLGELAQRGGLPLYSTATTRAIGMGWRGPYVNTGTSPTDFLTDAFGHPYTTDAGQVRSPGPDGVHNNADDIVYPPAAPVVSGSVFVSVKTIVDGKTLTDPPGYEVQLFYAGNGQQQSLITGASPYNFTNVPMGLHAIQVVQTTQPGAGTVVSQDTITVRPGSTVSVELWF
jgi:prepilin-type N-terminal cleavage/methylation domain-containing protein